MFDVRQLDSVMCTETVVTAVRCGKCRRYMKLIVAKPSRLHCASCDETLNVPQNCNIRLYKELRCPLDDYELLYCTTGTSGKVSSGVRTAVVGTVLCSSGCRIDIELYFSARIPVT